MKLTGQDRKFLREAIISAYPPGDELKMLLLEEMEVKMEEIIAKEKKYEVQVFDLIDYFESLGSIPEFIQAAYQRNKRNPELKAFYKNKFPFSLDSSESISEEEWESLKNILADIDYNIIEENCRKTLIGINLEAQCPSLIKVKSISTIKEILVNKYPLRKHDNKPTILELVQRLIDEEKISSSSDKKQLLQEWLSQISRDRRLSLPIEYSQPPKKYTQSSQEAYLLIEMGENPQTQGQFFLKSQIMLKYQGNGDEDLEKLEAIDINADSLIECSFDELKDRIAELIGQARSKLIRDYGYYGDIIVELFVQIGYLGHHFDLEKISVTVGTKTEFKPIASEYNFTLRCSDRYSLGLSGDSGRWLTQFQQRWRDLQQFLMQTPTKAQINSKCVYLNMKEPEYNWDKISTDWERNQIFAVNLAGYQSGEEKCQEFFKYLLKAGIPISLWNRYSHFEFAAVKKQFSKLITSSSLQHQSRLLQEIHRLRRDAHNEQNEEESKKSLGYHLGVLCEHPQRIPSWYNYPQGGDALQSYD